MPRSMDFILETQSYPTYRKIEDMVIYFRVIENLHKIVALAEWDDGEVSCRVTTDTTGDYEADVQALIAMIKKQREALNFKECS